MPGINKGKRSSYKPPYAVVHKSYRTMTFQVDQEMFDQLDGLAKPRNVTRGYLARELMKKALDEELKKAA